MHWVDRGPEPPGLKRVRTRHTPRWVDHYRHKRGPKPNDSHWRKFHENLRVVFFILCAYCEELCKGEVDHFRPKSRFPELVYEWSNWLFACHDCNHLKGGDWPRGGYIDPCAESRAEHPENHFDFDLLSGEILPKNGISKSRRQKAFRTIEDIDLNAYHHLKKRLQRIRLISEIIDALPRIPASEASKFRTYLENLCSRQTELSSISRAKLAAILPEVASPS